MNQIITEAKAEFIRAKERMAKALNTTSDDRINWSPSPTARTPVQQVVHSAIGTTLIGSMIMGKPFQYASMAEMDSASREEERKFSSREQALALLDETSGEYLAWLDTVTDEQLKSVVNFPMMEIPMAIAITIPADHLRSHASQIDYIQTVYGDMTFHM